MRAFLLLLSLLPLVVAAGAPADEPLIDASDPERIAWMAGAYGPAELVADEAGDPLITGVIGAQPYRIEFYGCSGGEGCATLMFQAVYQTDRASETDMSDWNREMRFGKAYLDLDGHPTIEMNVNLSKGVSRANLDETLDWWREVMGQFAEFLDL